ncbi:MAG TPA: hypothetical protein VJM31_16215 [Vicinamibacterales bacterium]|nr:hypothetical protein [Vicinamibacterales bacterium]
MSWTWQNQVMDEHEDDVEPEVDEGVELEAEEFPILDDDEDQDEDEDADIDPDASEI